LKRLTTSARPVLLVLGILTLISILVTLNGIEPFGGGFALSPSMIPLGEVPEANGAVLREYHQRGVLWQADTRLLRRESRIFPGLVWVCSIKSDHWSPSASSFLEPYQSKKQLPDIVYKDPSLLIEDRRSDGVFSLWVLPPKLLEATVTVTATTINMSLSKACPFTMDVSEKTISLTKPQQILRGESCNKDEPYSWHYQSNWKVGLRGGHHDDKWVYRIPFEKGTACPINQGYLGKFSHYEGNESGSEYAIDFGEPAGKLVCAARPGIVVAVRGDSNVGGIDSKKYDGASNYVVIKHSDGTYAYYGHLMHKSPLVDLGQSVVEGQPIAKVGKTGVTTNPHLHFDVYVPIDGIKRKTIPTLFRGANGKGVRLVEGQTYTVY
jgi:Peptidase family M23